MSSHWLQIKGDPSVRELVFQQTRFTSLFDQRIDQLNAIVEQLLAARGLFHAMIHYSSNQLTCWHCDDPYNYRVHVGEEVFAPAFADQFTPGAPRDVAMIPPDAIGAVLAEFKRLRFRDENFYLRNASINRINGIIGMTFSCDGSHYVPFVEFFQTAQQF
jgi:hypothetical protein